MGPASGHVGVRTNDPPPPPPSISVSKGGPRSVSGCTSNCYLVNVTMQNFSPNSGYTVACYSTMDTVPYYTYNVTTDGAGNKGSAVCVFGYAGQQVWVTAGGVTSGRVPW
jgi:hypothetical protein